MIPALAIARPVAPSRFPMAALWLLALVPGNAVVLLDLAHGVVRPAVWLARFVPALLVLALVGWSERATSPFAARLRKELRLTLFPGLLLLGASGVGLWSDLFPPGGGLAGLVHTMPWVLALVLPASSLLTPMTVEFERDTLSALWLSPRGARAFAEKYALGAGLVVLSWVQLSACTPGSPELWWFGLGGHVLAVATVPAWFLLGKKEGTALGLVTLVPFVVASPAALLDVSVVPTLATYGVVMLALVPWALERGLLAPAIGEQAAVPGATWASRGVPPLLAAELSGQRETLILVGVGVASFAGVRLVDGHEAAPMVLFFLSAIAAALSPSLAFAEAQRLGTLEALLVLRPRRAVFRLKVLTSLAVTLVACVLAPLLLLNVAGSTGRVDDVLGWLVGIGFVWSVALAVSVHLSGAGTALGTAMGLAFFGALAQVALFVGVSLGLSWLLDRPLSSSHLLGATMVGTAGIAAFIGWRRFVHLPVAPARLALLGGGLSLLYAAVMGAAGVVGGLISG